MFRSRAAATLWLAYRETQCNKSLVICPTASLGPHFDFGVKSVRPTCPEKSGPKASKRPTSHPVRANVPGRQRTNPTALELGSKLSSQQGGEGDAKGFYKIIIPRGPQLGCAAHS